MELLRIVNTSLRSQAFDVLKGVLKARGMTYAELARQMEVSEPTVKRLFVERDCKFSRLESICQLLDLSISEVLDIADRADEPVLTLSHEVEQALAESPALFHFYLLLRDEMSATEIASVHGLDDADLHLYARDLERLGLVKTGAMGRVTPCSSAPLQLASNGPLQRQLAEINLEFVRRSIAQAAAGPLAHVTISRRMRPETARLLEEDLKAMLTRIAKLARQDQLSSAQHELTAYKWSFAHGAASFASLLTIGPHPAKRC